ncbi:MAG: dTDP-glucose 4,6-dehydratase [Hydrogenothermaceae bacterium]|nr:dTDP-glucose 4,6-dehydratase [Hydrogenothermaceae bacterium]
MLVTGGAGFIGSWFVKLAVEKGYKVIVVDTLTYAGDLERLKDVQNNIKFYKTDITDLNLVEEVFGKENPDIVVHFAAESHVDRSILEPAIFIKTNVEGTFNLLEVSRKYPIEKFINISTDEVYGELENLEDQFTEETCLKPNSPYSSSKASADMLGRAYYKTYKLPVITVRPSNNYGPWQYPEKFIPVIILKALQNQPIPVYGNGKNRREWIFVRDCAEGVLTVMEKGKIGEIYNLGSGEEKENIEVVKTILEILGKSEDLITFVKDRPGHDLRYRMNSEKIKKELEFTPKTAFEEGIRQTIKFYIENMEWVKQKEEELKTFWQKVYE